MTFVVRNAKTLKENPKVIEFLQKQLDSIDSRRVKLYSKTIEAASLSVQFN